MTLSARVALAAALAALLAAALTGAVVLVAAGRADSGALDRELRSSLRSLRRPANRALRVAQPQAPGALNPGADRFARVVRRDGTVVRTAGAAVPGDFPALISDPALRTVDAGGERWRAAATGLRGAARLEVAARLAPLDARARRLRAIVALALLAAAAIAALAGLALGRLALAPLRALRSAAARVHDTGERVTPPGGPEEVAALGAELDGMLERLDAAGVAREAALDAARRFAADAGHELRTPLTSLRASLATLHRDDPEARAAALEIGERETARMAALVEQLQALARGEAGPPSDPRTVDLAEAADGALAALRARHPKVHATLDAPQGAVVVRADPDGVAAILDNLLENAAVHGGRRVAVTVGAGTIRVEDDGDGLDAAERDAVLARFARGRSARGAGSGLGLAIVAAQARRHGGELTLGDAPLGGLRAEVSGIS